MYVPDPAFIKEAIMLYTKEQVMHGIAAYIDNEVISKMPTAAKWIIGTGAALVVRNAENIDTSTMQMLGVVNNDGLWDVDMLAEVMKQNAERFGNIQLSIPIVGQMTFTSKDIDLLRRYIQ